MKMKKGFSLIEIGIVMIVIGILIASVMKGRDVIKNAEIKQMNQNFLSKWVTITASYYDRVGYNLTGSNTSRSMGVVDGLSDDDHNTTVLGCTSLMTYTKQAGIDVEKVISTNTNSPCRREITGEFTDKVTVGVGLESFRISTNEDSNTTQNFVLFFNMPGDVALSFDRLIDQQSNLTSGKVIALDVYDFSNPRVAGDMQDDNLTSGVAVNGSASGLAPLTSAIDAAKLYTIGVILEY